MIDNLLAALATNGIVLIALGFLIKAIIVHLLNKDISNYKAELQQSSEKETASYKSQLEIQQSRQRISYSGVFEKQAEAMMGLYSKILLLEGIANEGLRKNDNWNEYSVKLRECNNYYQEVKILVPEAVEPSLDKVLSNALDILVAPIDGVADGSLLKELRAAKITVIGEMRNLMSI